MHLTSRQVDFDEEAYHPDCSAPTAKSSVHTRRSRIFFEEEEQLDSTQWRSLKPLSPSHRYDDIQNMTICCFKRRFSNSWPEFARIFNRQFAAHLRFEGRCEMSSGALDRHFRSLIERRDAAFVTVYMETRFEDLDKGFGYEVYDLMVGTAQALDITLLRRHSDDAHSSKLAQRARQRAPRTQALPRINSLCTTLPNGDRGAPRILFRVWHSKSGGVNSPRSFRAGAFTTDADIPERPFEGQKLIRLAEVHLGKEKSFGDLRGSPFISTTPSLLWALVMANQFDGAQISIIDGSAAACKAHWFYCPDLLQNLSNTFRQDIKSYKGVYEWLWWGRVPSEAMVTTLFLSSLYDFDSLSEPDESVLQLRNLKRGKYVKVNQQALVSVTSEILLDEDFGARCAEVVCFLLSGASLHKVSLEVSNPLTASMIDTLLFDHGPPSSKDWRNHSGFLKGFTAGLKSSRLAKRPTDQLDYVSVPERMIPLTEPTPPEGQVQPCRPLKHLRLRASLLVNAVEEDAGDGLSDTIGDDEALLVKAEIADEFDKEHEERSRSASVKYGCLVIKHETRDSRSDTPEVVMSYDDFEDRAESNASTADAEEFFPQSWLPYELMDQD